MTVRIQAELSIDSRDRVGEGPVWDPEDGRLLWSDNLGGVIHEARPSPNGAWMESRRWTLERVKLAAVIPRSRGGFVIVADTEIMLMDNAGALEPFARIDADPTRISFNDAKCDSAGRLWAGSLAWGGEPLGALYRIDPDGAVNCMLDGLHVSNGLDWSPDGSTFYLIDSLALCVDAFDFDLGQGTISNRRTVVRLQRGEGGANGMTVDREGCLWVALTGGGEVRRYSPAGELLARVAVGAPLPTSCAFGGEDGGVLFITSRSGRLPPFAETVLGTPEAMMESEGYGAGGLWSCRPGSTGAPGTAFQG